MAESKSSNKKTTGEKAIANDSQTQPQVQYVVQEKSLEGIGGWLIFWLIVLGFDAVYGLIGFFGFLSILVDGSIDTDGIVSLIFAPLIAAISICAIIFISMHKKAGKFMAIGMIGLTTLYATVLLIANMVSERCDTVYSYSHYYEPTCTHMGASGIIFSVGMILVSWVVAGLFSLYFVKSKRVAKTLTK